MNEEALTRQEKRERTNEIEKFLIQAYIDKECGGQRDVDPPSQVLPPVEQVLGQFNELADCKHFIDQKTLEQAFVVGAMKAWPRQPFNSFEGVRPLPPNFEEVVRHLSQNIECLHFSFDDGLIKMSLSEIIIQVDVWMKDESKIDSWLAGGLSLYKMYKNMAEYLIWEQEERAHAFVKISRERSKIEKKNKVLTK